MFITFWPSGSVFSPSLTSRQHQTAFIRSSPLSLCRQSLPPHRLRLRAQVFSAAAPTSFESFFRCQTGQWHTLRCYFYRRAAAAEGEPPVLESERSETTFSVAPLTLSTKRAVLRDNGVDERALTEAGLDLEGGIAGFCVTFATVMERGERVKESTNLLFVPDIAGRGDGTSGTAVRGKYYRDRGYEEGGPIAAEFEYRPDERELLMITAYAKTVSVDRITLCNEQLRLRQITNYRRPLQWDPSRSAHLNRPLLQDVWLNGGGIEQKVA
ncbi:hypothetical protein CDCA_CDCA05G1674 [Cyanidium caldarium]|uniref:Uncharacterized protein n=1 Tax=Cyanidium caldarium TaxID=2771 RepID=A0AAV9ITN1_CYACA|nr:hypothetical protein CDCA_CDCA05G1674 [Cyanidium caldarium]